MRAPAPIETVLLALKLAAHGAAYAISLVADGLAWTWTALVGASDFLHARWTMRGGSLRCPRGHRIPTEGVFACGKCGFTYEGSIWRCGSVECRAVTPHVDCIECPLSVRNPYRWGR